MNPSPRPPSPDQINPWLLPAQGLPQDALPGAESAAQKGAATQGEQAQVLPEEELRAPPEHAERRATGNYASRPAAHSSIRRQPLPALAGPSRHPSSGDNTAEGDPSPLTSRTDAPPVASPSIPRHLARLFSRQTAPNKMRGSPLRIERTHAYASQVIHIL
jgi:hypothetical protein